MGQYLTVGEVAYDLAKFGNYHVLKTQQLAEKTFLHPSILLGLGLRETALQNICGGATWNGSEWVQAYTDRGWLQITDTIDANRKWLATQEGCVEGAWSPVEPPVTALTARHVPRFSEATEYVLSEFESNRRQADEAGVAAADVVRFCVAAHNAGFEGALAGYRDGNVDKWTAMGNYSGWVLVYSTVIHNWVVSHPNWVYKGQKI